MIERLALLLGHTSPETAYVVEDYPYGFRLRCKIRYWIETAEKGAKKGQVRFMSQTTNPRKVGMGDVWNKPKGSTYVALAWLYLDSEGHVQWTGVSPYGLSPELVDRYRLNGVYDQMPDDDRRFFDIAVKMAQRYPKSWQAWEQKVGMYVEALKATGEPPAMTNGTIGEGDTVRYVGAEHHDLATAVARERLAA